MKKKGVLGLLSTICALTAVGLTACGVGGLKPPSGSGGGSGAGGHTTHTYDKQVTTDTYKKSNATCQAKATYYYSCECGAKGTTTFETGGFKSHNMENGTCTYCNQGEAQGLEYELSEDETYYVVKGIGTCVDTDIIIPSEYEGQPVKEIGENAFSDKDTLTSVTMRAPITRIARWAFKDCDNLVSITLPESLSKIESTGFYDCENLEKVNYTGTVDSWAQIEFGYSIETFSSYRRSCMGNPIQYSGNLYINDVLLTDLNLTTTTKVADYAFDSCDSLKTVTIGGSVTTIGEAAFDQCNNVTSVTIGNGVTTIGEGAFYSCDKLSELRFGNSVTSIEKGAFQSCDGLTNITIPDSVTSIGSSAFYWCENLTSVTIPTSVMTMGEEVFANSYALTIRCETSSKPSDWDDTWDLVYSDEYTTPPKFPVVWDCNNNDVADDGSVHTIVDGLHYIIKDNKATVAAGYVWGSYHEYSAQPTSTIHVNIPSTIRYKGTSYPVTIGSYAFVAHPLESVTFAGGISSVPQGAFYNCDNLSSVTIGESISSIGTSAFTGCDSLISITIPDNVAVIDEYAFYGEAMTIYCEAGSALGSWDEDWTNLDEVVWDCNKNDVASDGYIYRVEDGVKYALKDGEATVVKQAMNIKTANILDKITRKGTDYSVTSIGDYAFRYCESLTSVTIGDSVTSIGEDAFRNCDSLTSVSIPDSVTSIGGSAFWYCDSLTKVNYTGTIDDWAQIEFANESANPIYYAKNLYINDVLVTEANITTATKISDHAFDNCDSLTSVKIGDSVTGIGSSAFNNCSNLASVTIGNSVTNIGNSAFSGCTSLTSIDIPDSVTSIGASAFSGCSSLTSATIPDSVESIGGYAFSGCSNLAKINYLGTIDDWVQIEFSGQWVPLNYQGSGNVLSGSTSWTYYSCGLYINDVLVTEANITTATKISDYAFAGYKTLTSVTIGDNVTSIGDATFFNCDALVSATISNKVESIGEKAFCGCRKLTIHCEAESEPSSWGNRWNVFSEGWSDQRCPVVWNCNNNDVATNGNIYTVIDAIRYTIKEGEATIVKCFGFEVISIVVPESILYKGNFYPVTGIGDSAFSRCTNLTSITIGDSVVWISSSAFDGCDSLTSVTLGDSVENISSSAFANCDNLQYTTYGNCKYLGTASNPYYALIEVTATNYSSYQIHEDTKTIADFAFSNCDSLTEIIIPDSVTSIGYEAFYDCDSLTSVTIGDGVESIGEYAFCYCDSLTKVNYTGTIDDWAQIEFGGGDANPLSYAKNLYINDELVTEANITTATKISDYAFYRCTSLTSVTIGDSVTSIGEDAFYWCDSLTSIEISDNVTNIGSSAFSWCDSLTSVTIPNSVTSIGNSAFYNCDSLTSVTIGDSVTSIGWYAFAYCNNLTEVYYKGTASEWSEIGISHNNTKLTNATRYYYVENEADVPTDGGNYWHYVDGVPTKWN